MCVEPHKHSRLNRPSLGHLGPSPLLLLPASKTPIAALSVKKPSNPYILYPMATVTVVAYVPSSPVSTASDSRSSRKISLPPWQREPASLGATLVHSTLSQQNTSRSQERERRGEGGRERERERQPTPLPLSSSLKRCHLCTAPSLPLSHMRSLSFLR